MADDLDAMLEGSNQDPASQAQTTDNAGAAPQEQQPSPEEAEWDKLSGSSRDRFSSMARRLREAEQKAEQINSVQNSVPPPPPQQFNPQVKEAVSKLDEVGIATKDFVQNQMNETLGNFTYKLEMDRLSSKFNGDNGEPQFVQAEYEQFVKDHPQYQSYLPEDVFHFKMFPDEFQSLQSAQASPKGTRTLKPTRTQVMKESLTPETIEEKLRSLPDSEKQAWYNENIDEINKVLGRQAQG